MQTIGERLEEARKRKGSSIREAAEATKIRGDYLQKFENNQFDINLSDIYVRGFLRTYCNFLKLPHERILADFRALGLGENNKPKGVSREVYGRMDISFASSSGSAKAKDDLPSPSSDDSGSESGGTKRTFARIGTSLPEGTFIDQRLLLKIGGILGAVVVIGLIFWGIKAISSSQPQAASTASQTQRAPQPNEKVITLIANDAVNVTVAVQAGKDLPPGEVLFSGTLARGESRTIARGTSWLSLQANAMENLEMDINGTRYKLSTHYRGNTRIQLPPQ